MIKVKFLQKDIHRNETTFRPVIAAANTLREVGIEITDSDDYDYAIIGHGSISNKKVSLRQSIDDGLKFLDSVTGDYIIFDGQDSTSLIGTVDVFRHSKAEKFLKINYLEDRSLYKKFYVGGRYYWGEGGNYNVPDIDKLSDNMLLSGTNWVNTYCTDNVLPVYTNVQKRYDVSAMFQYPLNEEVFEHGLNQSFYYNRHREDLMQIINNSSFTVAKLNSGQRVPENEYYQKMFESKIILAPFGFGELPPRDIQSAQFECVLIKPDVSYIDTVPNIYVDGETYISCKHDFSDVEDKIKYVLSNYDKLQPYLVNNMRRRFLEVYSHENLALHWYKIFLTMKNITT